MAKKRNSNTDDIQDDEIDDINLILNFKEKFTFKSAARHSRLPYDSLSELESSYFKNVETTNYLNIRNAILKIWLEKPTVLICF